MLTNTENRKHQNRLKILSDRILQAVFLYFNNFDKSQATC